MLFKNLTFMSKREEMPLFENDRIISVLNVTAYFPGRFSEYDTLKIRHMELLWTRDAAPE